MTPGGFETQPRTVSFDDGFFPEFHGRVLLVGVVMRGNEVVENVVAGEITVDGDDATAEVARLVKGLPQELNAIFLDGIAFGGFNVLDLKKIQEKTRVPTIAVTRANPDLKEIHNALNNVPNSEKKWARVQSNSPPMPHGKLFFQCQGVTPEKAKQLINSCSKSGLPEGLRLAHLIASGVTRSVSIGKD